MVSRAHLLFEQQLYIVSMCTWHINQMRARREWRAISQRDSWPIRMYGIGECVWCEHAFASNRLIAGKRVFDFGYLDGRFGTEYIFESIEWKKNVILYLFLVDLK